MKSNCFQWTAWRDTRGAVIVEFAVLLTLFILVAVVATDISLSILARQQVQNAARAGAEYAATRGYDIAKIKDAALSANAKLIATFASTDITPTLECGCITSTSITYTSITLPSACTTCSVSPGLTPSLFANITIQGNYKPLLPFYWGSYVSGSGSILFTATVKVRTFNPS